MKKRAISLMLIAAMSMSLCACGGDDKKTSTEETKKPSQETDAPDATDAPKKEFEISMLYSDNANYPYSKDWAVWDIIKEKTGATFNVQVVPESDYVTQRNILMQSGSLPDIITKTFPEANQIASGQLLAISDYEDQMPNYKAWIDKYNFREAIDRKKAADGKYYIVPVNANRTKVQDHMWMIRTDIFEKNNIPVPKTQDDLFEAGKKLKEIYKDSTPITNRFQSANIMSGFAAGFDTIAGWTIGDGTYYDAKADKWEFAPTTDKWKDMVTYVNKLYTAGVLDKEYSTLDSTIYEQRITQGKTFIMYDWAANCRRYNEEGKKNDPDYNVAPIYPITGPDGSPMLQWTDPWEQAWILPASLADDEEHLKEVLSFIDWCFTDEAETLLTFGREGDTCTGTGEEVKYMDDTKDYNALAGLNNNCLTVRRHPNAFANFRDEAAQKVFDEIGKANIIADPNPTSPLSIEQIEANSVKTTSIIDYVNNMMEGFVNGRESLDKWDDFVKQCESKGSKELVDEYNEAWANRKK